MSEQKLIKYRLIIIFGFVGVALVVMIVLGQLPSSSNVELTFNSEVLSFRLNNDEDNLIAELDPEPMAKMILERFASYSVDDSNSRNIDHIILEKPGQINYKAQAIYSLYLQSLVISKGTKISILHRKNVDHFTLELFPSTPDSTHYLNFFLACNENVFSEKSLKKNNIELRDFRFRTVAIGKSKISLTPSWKSPNNEISFLKRPISISLVGFRKETIDSEKRNVISTLTINGNKKGPFKYEFIQLSSSNSLSLSELVVSQDGLRGKLSGYLSYLEYSEDGNKWIKVSFPSLLEKLNFELEGFEKTIAFLALYVITPLYFILGEILLVIMVKRSTKSNKHFK